MAHDYYRHHNQCLRLLIIGFPLGASPSRGHGTTGRLSEIGRGKQG